MRLCIISKEQETFEIGYDGEATAALESRLQNSTYHIERLAVLCDALLYRIGNTADGSEIDQLRGEIANYLHQIMEFESDGREVAEQLRKFKGGLGQ